jgi:hypothetical protein
MAFALLMWATRLFSSAQGELDMFRLAVAGATLALFASLAVAQERVPPSAGAKGTITAWDESNTRVLEHRFCVRTRYSWDYPACGNRLRDQLKRRFCAANPPGTYKYLTQVGDGKPYRSTLVCR